MKNKAKSQTIVLSIILAIALLLGMMPITVFAAAETVAVTGESGVTMQKGISFFGGFYELTPPDGVTLTNIEWSVSGDLPAGITLGVNSSDGAGRSRAYLDGAPTAMTNGAVSVTIHAEATDGTNTYTGSLAVSITVEDSPAHMLLDELIQGAVCEVPMTTANTQEAVIAWMQNTWLPSLDGYSELVGRLDYGWTLTVEAVSPSVEDIGGFTAAVAGTAADPDGTDGSLPVRFRLDENYNYLDHGKQCIIKANEYVAVRIEDDADVLEVTFTPVEGVTLPDGAEVVVEHHTPSADNLGFLLPPDANTEYVDLDDERISMYEIEWFSITYEGVTYKMGEYIIIDGLVYFISGVDSSGYSLHLIRTDNKSDYILHLRSDNLINNRDERRFDVPTNKKVFINGITYDVKCIFNTSGVNDDERVQWMLYYGGEPVGTYFPGQSMAVFHEGYDPATLNAKKNASNLGTVTLSESPVDGLVSGKTYNVSVIGSNDIHLEGAENIGGTVTQTFDIPVEFIGNENVKYVAVHNTNPHATALAAAKYKMEEARADYWEYHGDSSEERQRLYEAANRASMEWAIVQEHYDAWEREHAVDTGTGNELGTVTIAEDGKTLTATYTVDSFSPFIVYAFVEADEPEVKTLSATIHTEHTGGTATCKTLAVCEVCGESYGELVPHTYEDGTCTVCGEADPDDQGGLETWVIVLIVVGSVAILGGAGFAVYWFVIRKKRV